MSEEEIGNVKCNRCKTYRFPSQFYNEKKRLMKCCDVCRGKFKCEKEGCECKFRDNSALQRHIKLVHDKIKDFHCTIDNCDFKTGLKNTLKNHVMAVHDKIKNYVCSYENCNASFTMNTDLTKHVNNVHINMKKYKCEFCDYKSNNKCHVSQHIDMVHNNMKDYQCEDCGTEFSAKSSLIKHLNGGCTGKRNCSAGEYQVIQALESLGFEENKDFIYNSSLTELTDWAGKILRFDFRFTDHKIVIEYDGIQHFQLITFGCSEELSEENFQKIKDNDNMKNKFCEEFGYKMIRISYKDFEGILGILVTELNDIINWIG
jgi:hypothetical protein